MNLRDTPLACACVDAYVTTVLHARARDGARIASARRAPARGKHMQGVGKLTPVQRRVYSKLRRAGVGRDEAYLEATSDGQPYRRRNLRPSGRGGCQRAPN